MIRTIYVKLVLIFICIFILGNTAAFFISSLTTEKSLTGELADSLSTVLVNVREIYEEGELPAEKIEKLYATGIISIRFYTSASELQKDYTITEGSLTAAAGEPVAAWRKRADGGHPRMPASILRSGSLFIAAAPRAGSILQDLRNLILQVNLLSLLFGSIVMLIVARFIVKPVRRLSAAAGKIAKGDFQVSIEKNRHDEIGQLIDNFNLMARELAGMEMLRNDFVSDISHEFKTPLTSIEGYVKLLRNCENASERNEYIDIILEETKRLSAMSGNILLLNRLENENIPLAKEPFRLDEQIRQVILLQENKWNDRKIDLQLDLDEIEYAGSEPLLFQVWLNLFDNAVKFSEPGGTVEISLRKTDGKAVFTVTDYGRGMTEEEKKRMFEKFFTGDRSRNSEGNGLGLSIAKRVVDMHGGRIDVVSKLGEFTTIRVTL